jgi:hypothetical protein
MRVLNMKKVAVYAISILGLSVLLSTCYYISYRYAFNKFNQKAAEQSDGMKDTSIDSAQDVSASIKTVVSPGAVYTEQVYDISTKKQKEEKKNIPNEFIGLTREQVEARMHLYVQNKSLQEHNKGLVSYELVSFAADKIVAKKTYNSKAILYKYIMAIRDHEVVVYYSDRKTVYEDETGVCLETLSEQEKIELQYGKPVKDKKELYSILENYTS